MKIAIKFIAVTYLLISATAVFAHITLEERRVPVGSSYRAVFRVGHGCEGAATTAIAITLPEGFQAKPMPKAGWSLQTGSVIRWTADTPQSALADAHYDEFILRGKLPNQAGPLWFKVLQTCASSSIDWSQVPAMGTSTQGLTRPAALLEVVGNEAPPPLPAHLH